MDCFNDEKMKRFLSRVAYFSALSWTLVALGFRPLSRREPGAMICFALASAPGAGGLARARVARCCARAAGGPAGRTSLLAERRPCPAGFHRGQGNRHPRARGGTPLSPHRDEGAAEVRRADRHRLALRKGASARGGSRRA